MHRVGGRTGRFFGALALVGATLFASTTAAAPPAFADGATNCTFGLMLCTGISLSGDAGPARDTNGTGGTGSGGGDGFISPCWIQPLIDPDTGADASSPAGFAQYFQDWASTNVDHNPGEDATSFYTQSDLLYYKGSNPLGGKADPGVGLVPAANFNTSGAAPGRWYGIACDPATFTESAVYGIQDAFGVSAAQINYELWFWIPNGQPAPAGVQMLTPDLLARYAANHVKIDPAFPALSPAADGLQTVNLPVRSVNGAGDNGYYTYSTTATLGAMVSTVTAAPVSVTYTASPGGLITPASVTCSFATDGSGAIAEPCDTFQFTEPAAATLGYTITATSTWSVTWGGNADYNEAGWTEALPGPNPAVQQNVTIQEIQTIN